MKAKSNPAAEPDFYSMPSIKARDDASTKWNSDLDGKKPPSVYPLLHSETKHEYPMGQIKEHVPDDDSISSLGTASLAVDAPNYNTQAIGSTTSSTVPPSPSLDLKSNTTRRQSERMTFRRSSYTKVSRDELTSSTEPASWAEPANHESLFTENSAMQLLREPILTPSVSSSSLHAMSNLQELHGVNVEPNFVDNDWGSFAW